jgi:serine/threonine-protein phosphatase 2A regulatory subunit B''
MIVDRIFDAAPRPFEGSDPATVDENGNVVPKVSRNYLSYEDFIFFMLSEEDKANEFSVRYWFTCVDVDGDEIILCRAVAQDAMHGSRGCSI